MSRGVYLSCLDCKGANSDSINHGEEALRAMWKSREAIVALNTGNAWSIQAQCSSTYRSGDWWHWIATHAKCKVELRDEYGGTADVDAQAGCIRFDVTLKHDGTWRVATDDWSFLRAKLQDIIYAMDEYKPRYTINKTIDGKVHVQ